MTDHATRVKILTDLVIATANVPQWNEYKRAADLGIALAVAESSDLATVNDKGKKYVNSAYILLLEVLELDGEYESIDQVFDAAIAKGSETA
jgi:hypothetical protein